MTDLEKIKELFEKKRLNNNLDLVIYFIYKHIAGDRCQVTFEAEIDVKIKEDYFKDRVLNNLDIKSVRSLLGEKTSYNYRKTRKGHDNTRTAGWWWKSHSETDL